MHVMVSPMPNHARTAHAEVLILFIKPETATVFKETAQRCFGHKESVKISSL